MSRAAWRNPPSWVLVSLNSSMAAAPDSGRNADSGVGTGEKVFVSCIIIATTIFSRPLMVRLVLRLFVHGELHEVAVGVTEVHARGRTARAHARAGSRFGRHAA